LPETKYEKLKEISNSIVNMEPETNKKSKKSYILQKMLQTQQISPETRMTPNLKLKRVYKKSTKYARKIQQKVKFHVEFVCTSTYVNKYFLHFNKNVAYTLSLWYSKFCQMTNLVSLHQNVALGFIFVGI